MWKFSVSSVISLSTVKLQRCCDVVLDQSDHLKPLITFLTPSLEMCVCPEKDFCDGRSCASWKLRPEIGAFFTVKNWNDFWVKLGLRNTQIRHRCKEM